MLPEYEESDVVRFSADYENRSQKFLLRDKAYIKQFFSFYMSRLEKVAESVTDAAKDKWGSDVPIKKLADLREDENDRCILVGTLYKQQKLKPSILREISDENHVAPQPTTIFYDDSDKVILEDGLNRIALSGKIDASKLVTGIVCALLGELKLINFQLPETILTVIVLTTDVSPSLFMIPMINLDRQES